MLPPYLPKRSWSSFFRRLLHWELIDWESTFTQLVSTILNPSKLSMLATHRLQSQGQLARGDPGVFLGLIYLAAATGFTYGSATIASYNARNGALRGSFWILMGGFVIWPAIATLILTVAMSCGLFTLLKKLNRIPRRSLAFTIAHSIRPAVTVIFNDKKGNTSDESNASFGATSLSEVDLAYCFDLVCNASVAGLSVLGVLQYHFLPIASQDSLVGALAANAFNVLASFLFVYNVASGIAILKAPLWRVATMLFIPLAVWVLILVLLTILKVNLTNIILSILFGAFLPSTSLVK
eukprot:Blabericola_migrator_1__3703@NODE_2107_length_3266_cov_40_337606_g1335_i0_p2_GENE_NODE_2107_length_3266_cov_40_337606_g1335_i0NODE_2107_length_3266_cov_40_337606_g1335_i0_p2_ORF_typecomplete_len295_score27_03UNC50/PF05216_13/1_2e26_NODE_2107_length_3266_cov_40_337606_g1335_i014372321